jgi:hypothetical protein
VPFPGKHIFLRQVGILHLVAMAPFHFVTFENIFSVLSDVNPTVVYAGGKFNASHPEKLLNRYILPASREELVSRVFTSRAFSPNIAR